MREILALTTILTGILITLGTCPAFGRAVNRPVKYVWLGGGCFVQDVQGNWFHQGNYWNAPQQGEH